MPKRRCRATTSEYANGSNGQEDLAPAKPTASRNHKNDGAPMPDVIHAAGGTIAQGGFRTEARTTPPGWEIVQKNQEWRDYC